MISIRYFFLKKKVGDDINASVIFLNKVVVRIVNSIFPSLAISSGRKNAFSFNKRHVILQGLSENDKRTQMQQQW